MSQVLSRSEMTEVSLKDLYDMAKECYDSIWEQAQDNDRGVKIYLHWSAGLYHQFWDDYHIQVDSDGKIYVPDDTALDDVLSATWKRNSGSISIGLLCGYGATTEDLGDYPPTEAQMESTAMIIAVLVPALDITTNIMHVMTHGEAADNEDEEITEDYGPKTDCERWDLEYLGTDESPEFDPWNEETRGGTILRGKAIWYRTEYNCAVHETFKNSAERIE